MSNSVFRVCCPLYFITSGISIAKFATKKKKKKN